MTNRVIVMLAPFGLRPKATLSRRALPLGVELARRGYHVHILAPSDLWPADAGRVIPLHGVTIEHSPLTRAPGPAAMLQTSAWMLRRTLQLQPSLVHLFKPKGYGGMAAAWLRWQRPDLPLVVDTDDWEGKGGWNDRLSYPAPIKLLIDWQERMLPRFAQHVTVASRTLEEQVRGFGVPAERISYIPNGVVVPGFALSARSTARSMLGLDARPTVLLYTRFWEFAVRDVVACLVGLVHGQPNVRLLVLGAGEQGEERELQRLAERAGVASALDQRGWANEAQIAAALAGSDVALYPMDDTLINRAKCSAKLADQMQAGLAIVAAAVGQVPEYIRHGEHGLLVKPGDGGALAQSVLRLLHHTAFAARLGGAAQERIEHEFAWPRLADRLVTGYRKAQHLVDGASQRGS